MTTTPSRRRTEGSPTLSASGARTGRRDSLAAATARSAARSAARSDLNRPQGGAEIVLEGFGEQGPDILRAGDRHHRDQAEPKLKPAGRRLGRNRQQSRRFYSHFFPRIRLRSCRSEANRGPKPPPALADHAERRGCFARSGV